MKKDQNPSDVPDVNRPPKMESLGAYVLVLILGLPIYLIGLAIGFVFAMLSKNKAAARD